MLHIQSSQLSVDILPEVGGKIGQIRYKPLGRELLIPPQKPWRTIPVDGDWLAADTSGMDDCFPNVAAGKYPGENYGTVLLPDLGEWSHGTWDVLTASDGSVRMQRRGHRLPWLVHKNVRAVDETTLEFSWQLANQGRYPLPYLWSAHPLFAVPERYRIVLPGRAIVFRTFPDDGRVHRWPLWQETDLSHAWNPPASTLKIFLSGLEDGWCELQLPEFTIRLTYSLRSTPVLGIWFNNYGFPAGSKNAFRCIALEPCTSPSDLLDDLASSAYPVLRPGDSHAWSLRLQVRAGAM